MKRCLICTVLALVLTLALGGAALASPPMSGQSGSYYLFGEYSPSMFSMYAPVFGAGYVFSDSFTIGGGISPNEFGNVFSGFIDYALTPFVIKAGFQTVQGITLFDAAGLYQRDLYPFQIGLGGGLVTDGSASEMLLEGTANMALNNQVTLYGTLDYIPAESLSTFTFGASLSL